MNKSCCKFYKSCIGENSFHQRKLFASTKTLLNHTHEVPYPLFKDKLTFANEMGSYFIEKIDNIQAKLDNVASGLSSVPPSSNSCLHPCNIMDRFSQLLENDVHKLIKSSAKKSLKFDPMPTPLVVNCSDSLLPVIHQDINLSLSTGYFLTNGNPLLKKPGLDLIFKNYRPVSNLQDVPKLTERAVFEQVHLHMETKMSIDPLLRSAYRTQHSTETALLKVMNDVLLKMNSQHVTLLVMLDLSAAFDTVNHKILLERLQHEIGISGVPLQWFKAYLYNRSQSIAVQGTLSRLFYLECGVP